MDGSEAWDVTTRSMGYTNRWRCSRKLWKALPLAWFEMMVPRHLEIIYEINRRLLDKARSRYPGDEERIRRISLVEEGAEQKIRMANLAIVGSHSTNGVAAMHSDLLRRTTVNDLAQMYPERFNNKTNGVTPRRWLLLSNPGLAHAITEAIGNGWITDLGQLHSLRLLADDKSFPERFPQSPASGQASVRRLAEVGVRENSRPGYDL